MSGTLKSTYAGKDNGFHGISPARYFIIAVAGFRKAKNAYFLVLSMVFTLWSKIQRGFIVLVMFSINPFRPLLAVAILVAAVILLVSSPPAWAGHDPCIDLIEAAFLDDTNEIHDLFNRKVDVNCRDAEGQTPLMMAAEGGSVVAVRMMLAWNAEVNLWDKYGQSALDRARGKLELFHMEGAEHIHMIYQGIIRMLKGAGAVEKQPRKPKKRS